MVAAGENEFVVQKISPAQKQAARFLSNSQSEAVQVGLFGEARVCELVALRNKLPASSPKPTISHFLIAALVQALEIHPQFNAHFEDNQLKLFKNINVGLAVSTPDGNLLVPVLKNLQGKSLLHISEQANAMSHKARNQALQLSDIRGGGFTLSNVGQAQTTRYATPVIPLPQIAILAVTAIRKVPVVEDGNIIAADILPLSLCFDHRAVNGSAAVNFLETINAKLRSPEDLL